MDNQLQANDALPPETELAKQLGISRNSVREAVKSLESLGIVETRRGSGIFVREFSFEPLLDNLAYSLLFDLEQTSHLSEVRRVLEVGMIEQAMKAMSSKQMARLQDVTARMKEKAEKSEPFLQEDREFHQCLFENLGNKVLLKVLDAFWLSYRKASEQTQIEIRDPMYTYQFHEAILNAIAARNTRQAKIALDQHYDGLNMLLTEVKQDDQKET
ncbi:MAG: FadR/GntR family transcriptional regulator [Chloroflexota bacterium]